MSKETKGLMRVTVQIGDRRFDEDLARQLFIAPDLGGIDEALETGPARQAEWAMLAALARTEHDEIKGAIGVIETQIKDQEAKTYLEVVAAAIGPKMTVDAVKAMVQIDPARLALVAQKQEMEQKLREAADSLRVLEVGKETMKDRKDYVIERARDARAEMQARMSVRMPEGESIDRYKPGGR
jgi:hypothetical protein